MGAILLDRWEHHTLVGYALDFLRTNRVKRTGIVKLSLRMVMKNALHVIILVFRIIKTRQDNLSSVKIVYYSPLFNLLFSRLRASLPLPYHKPTTSLCATCALAYRGKAVIYIPDVRIY